MSAFQILNKENNPIEIGELDRQVSEITGNPQQGKYYTDITIPDEGEDDWDYQIRAQNWYDSIGWLIASRGFTFKQIIEYYTEPMKKFLGVDETSGKNITIEDIYPGQMKVLKTWIEKGYTTKQIIQ